MTPNPKPVAQRNPALLALARGRRCLLMVVDNCETTRGSSTVACHSNALQHGKGRGRKADDNYTVWGCARCHMWLDESWATRAEKREAFEGAYKWQIIEWQKIADDENESEKNRNAAKWALERI